MEIETFYTGMDTDELAKKLSYTAKNNDTVFSVHITSTDDEGLDEVANGFEIKRETPNYFDLDEQDYNDFESLQYEIPNGAILILFKNDINDEKLHYAYDERSKRTVFVSSINILGYLKNTNGLFFVKNPECELSLETEVQEETPIKLELK